MKSVQSSLTPSPPQVLPEVAHASPLDLAVNPGCNLRLFKAGETIFREGDEADKAYIIESGYVEIFVGSGEEAIQLNVLGPGDIFGEMGIVDTSPRSASVKAIGPCRCMVILASQIVERIDASSPIVQLLIAMSLHRNRAYNTYLKTHLKSPHLGLPSPALTERSYTKSHQYQTILDSIKLESDLQNAVANHELRLFYQPLLDLNQGEVIGFESLLRWQSPTRGRVSPYQFIGLAEETSLIVPIGLWILAQACTDLKRFEHRLAQMGQAQRPLFVSVNISVRQFQEPDFFEQLITLSQRHGVSPQQLKLEVTERVFLDEVEAIATITQCRAAGFHVSLDDFGTGYSSLNYLERCEIDSLKIDQSFIQKLCTSERAKILVGSIIEIARRLGLPTVAEGIETAEQRAVLQALGCEVGQGFLFSQPIAFAEAIALL
ncbi:MAG: EAL domain-containing protein [Leptolyngbya sp. LCM1.Bin17]|nr:MAG: EAL domain-containing protein [Leptolyngbya sp. LCM1.Bin17]